MRIDTILAADFPRVFTALTILCRENKQVLPYDLGLEEFDLPRLDQQLGSLPLEEMYEFIMGSESDDQCRRIADKYDIHYANVSLNHLANMISELD